MDPVARRGAVFVVGVLLALIGGYYVGKAAVPPTRAPSVADHAHTGLEWSLALEETAFPLGTERDLRFRISGGPVADLHVVVVRSDLTGYQHLHPTPAADGMWSVPLTLRAAGTWRVFADFAAGTASSSVLVAGAFDPVADLPSSDISVDGRLRPGGTEPLTLRVPAGPLERYLGAYGHLVLVRAGDLAFVHVHADKGSDGNSVRFWVTPPGPGTYRAYFDHSVAGVVRTAEFTITV